MFIWLLNEYLEHFLVCLVYYCLLTLFYHKRDSSFVSVLHLFFCLVLCFLCLDFNIMFDSTRLLSRTLMVHLWYASSIMANQNDCSLRFLNTYVNCKMCVVTNYFPKTINNISSFLEPWHLARYSCFYTHFVLSKGFHIQSILKKYIEKRSRIFMRVNKEFILNKNDSYEQLKGIKWKWKNQFGEMMKLACVEFRFFKYLTLSNQI